MLYLRIQLEFLWKFILKAKVEDKKTNQPLPTLCSVILFTVV
jgi:hypothetical protein